MRTQIAIVGAGPAGLLLGHLLHGAGIDSVIIEQRSRSYCEQRIRAGVLEQGTVDLLRAHGLQTRLDALGMIHHSIDLRFDRQAHRIDLPSNAGGRCVTVYPQHEIVADLIASRVASGAPLLFDCAEVALHDDASRITFTHDGRAHDLRCDFVAGCDGFHGVCRRAIPAAVLQVWETVYPFAWLGVLAEAPPASVEVIYAHHPSGFALQSMRTPSVSRLYVQCAAEDRVEDWSDDRFWSEFQTRIGTADGWHQREGRITQKGITGMRSFVAEPMRHGRIFLAGDAAHIVPPTGAKGLNLAAGDVKILADAFAMHYREGRDGGLDRYSETALRRVWRVQRFASMLCRLLHVFPGMDAFQQRLQLAELDYLVTTDTGARMVAENYTGLPFYAAA